MSLNDKVKVESLSVLGTDNLDVPREMDNWFKTGEGLTFKFLKEVYGMGRSLVVGAKDVPRAYV